MADMIESRPFTSAQPAKTASAVAKGWTVNAAPSEHVQTLMPANTIPAFSMSAFVAGFTPQRRPCTNRLRFHRSIPVSASVSRKKDGSSSAAVATAPPKTPPSR